MFFTKREPIVFGVVGVEKNGEKEMALSGKDNPQWKGGVAEYPNHYLMKKNRLIILLQNPKCEICKKSATQIHHRNKNKSDHRLKNLIAVCHKCHIKIFHSQKRTTSKYRRLYGKTLKELGKKFKLSERVVHYRLKNNIPLSMNRWQHPNSKFRKLYGMTLEEMAEKTNKSLGTCWKLHQQNKLREVLKMEKEK